MGLENFYHVPTDENDPYRAKVSYVMIAISFLGFAASLYALILHLQLKLSGGAPLSCDINDLASCSKIIGSRYGEFLAIPLGAWGMSFFGVTLAIALLPLYAYVSKRTLMLLSTLVTSVGLVVALIAAYVAYVVLKGVCMVCSTIQLCTLLYFIISLRGFLKVRKEPLFAERKVVFKFVIAAFILGTMPILSGYLGGLIARTMIPVTKSPLAILDSNAVDEKVAHFSRGRDGAAEDFRKGSESARLVLVEFTDFECPYCQKLHSRLKEVQDKVGKENLLIVFRNWPIPYHKYAFNLAIAARCAAEQGKFWSYTDSVYLAAMTAEGDSAKKEQAFNSDGVLKMADELGLGREKFASCLESPEIRQKIETDARNARELGGTGTPFLLLNGVPYQGNWLEPGEMEKDLLQVLQSIAP